MTTDPRLKLLKEIQQEIHSASGYMRSISPRLAKYGELEEKRRRLRKQEAQLIKELTPADVPLVTQ